jgi:tetratricopeptide (TPR) repeat protein
MDEAGAQPSRDLDERDMSDELIGLSAVYRHERRYDDALETMKRCESIDDEIANSKFEKANAKPNTPSIYFWLSQIELAEVYRERGETAAAEPVFQRSVEMAQNLRLVPGHPKLAQLYDNYATLIRDEGKYGEAEALYKRALDTWAKSRYPDHPDVAGTLTNYAALLRKVSRPAEAEPLEARAREVVAKASVPASVN